MSDQSTSTLGSKPIDPSAQTATGRVSLNLFGIPLGLAGLGGGWNAAASLLGAPVWPEEALYGVASVLWLLFTALYLVQGAIGTGSFRADLKHPLSGPFASYIPLVGILLAAHYSLYFTVVGGWVTFGFIAALAVVTSQLIAHWFSGGVSTKSIHPGYFVPTVAGANVASIGFTTIHQHDAAIGAFGVGLFFWLVIGTVVLGRLMSGAPLPEPLKPALSAFLAAAATSNLAWIIANPGPFDEVQLLLTGILVIMLLVQVVMLNEYRKLSFSASFWIFTFPLASTTNYAIRWFANGGIDGWPFWAWSILGLTSVFVVFVAVRTVSSQFSAPAIRP